MKTTGISETCLYVDDMERAVRFYAELLSCPVVRRDEKLSALRVAEQQVLLLFDAEDRCKRSRWKAERFRRTMGTGRYTCALESARKKQPRGKGDCASWKSQSKAG
jgi:catechol 2,3-dioxygenase-like lactoylglutathione lyase family enzyme